MTALLIVAAVGAVLVLVTVGLPLIAMLADFDGDLGGGAPDRPLPIPGFWKLAAVGAVLLATGGGGAIALLVHRDAQAARRADAELRRLIDVQQRQFASHERYTPLRRADGQMRLRVIDQGAGRAYLSASADSYNRQIAFARLRDGKVILIRRAR